MSGTTLPPLRDVIKRHGLSARKSLGQNFLFDLNLTARIARASGPFEGATVLEIGPGPGGLTRALLSEGAERVIAVERDDRCLPALEELSEAHGGKLEVIAADAMAVNEATALAERNVTGPVRVAANLPYNVGTALLIKWLSIEPWRPWWASLTLMFQREVAERIVAAPDTEAYGRLSVLAQWRSRPRILFDVHRSAFTPPPKVTSTVVRFEPRLDAMDVPLKALEAVTGAAFGQRRKMLRGSLKSLGVDTEALLTASALNPEARAETIDLAGFMRLAKAYAAIRSQT